MLKCHICLVSTWLLCFHHSWSKLEPINTRDLSHFTWEWMLLVPIHIKDTLTECYGLFCPIWKGFEKKLNWFQKSDLIVCKLMRTTPYISLVFFFVFVLFSIASFNSTYSITFILECIVPIRVKYTIWQDMPLGLATLRMTIPYHTVSSGSYSEPLRDPLQPPPLLQLWSLTMAVATMATSRLQNARHTKGWGHGGFIFGMHVCERVFYWKRVSLKCIFKTLFKTQHNVFCGRGQLWSQFWRESFNQHEKMVLTAAGNRTPQTGSPLTSATPWAARERADIKREVWALVPTCCRHQGLTRFKTHQGSPTGKLIERERDGERAPYGPHNETQI